MTRQEIEKIFEEEKDNFDLNKSSIEKEVVNRKYSKCEYFEVLPFSYQRLGFKQGKLIDNYQDLKNKEDTYLYGFNSKNKIIEIKEGISLEDQFYYQFFFYEKNTMKSLQYDNSKTLQNVRYTFFDDNGQVINMVSQGRRGGREDVYKYSNDGFLEYILIRQFDRRGNEADSITHQFSYFENNELKNIKKVFKDNTTEIIYEV